MRLISSAVGDPSVAFMFGAVIDNGAMTTGCMSPGGHGPHFPEYTPRDAGRGHRYVQLYETRSRCFPKLCHFTPQPSMFRTCRSLFPVIVTLGAGLFHFSHSGECARVSHCGRICIFLLADNVGHLSLCLLASWVFSVTGVCILSCRGLIVNTFGL